MKLILCIVIVSPEAQLKTCPLTQAAAPRSTLVGMVLSGESLMCRFKPDVLFIQSGS